jgi:hypothetical protein
MKLLYNQVKKMSAFLPLLLIFLLSSSVPAIDDTVPGVEGTFEYAFDAPWRIEPSLNDSGDIEYGLIPIQITIHDAMFADLDDDSRGIPSMFGKYTKIVINEVGGFTDNLKTEYKLEDLYEIEMTVNEWKRKDGSTKPINRICRIWKGDNPESFRDIAPTSEWHALIWYQPKHKPKPGSVLPLEITMEIKQPVGGNRFFLKNYVDISFGEEPLPRFDNKWLYGDLHYHSQGTDNEGESAYNYRGVVRTMGAMGLDFVMATEHASNANQFVDVDIYAINIGLDWKLEWDLADMEFNEKVHVKSDVLRDMSFDRFSYNHALIWEDGGVNKEAAYNAFANRRPQNVLSHSVVPQVFLGGELDVIPENDSKKMTILYGKNKRYDMNNLLKGWATELNSNKPTSSKIFEQVGNEFLIQDVQGINQFDYGREHLIYLPKTSNATYLKTKGDVSFQSSNFIPSNTGTYGGASRRLSNAHKGQKPLLPEIEEKGYAFLAHHLNSPGGSPGPDGPPWTEHMLRKAWKSPGILGLQFWNEDSRFDLKVNTVLNGPITGTEWGYTRTNSVDIDLFGIYTHLDVQKDVPSNGTRHGFFGGGFGLTPYDARNGSRGDLLKNVEHDLFHGAISWDNINKWGLDKEQTKALKWLQNGEPRKFLMAGGSDSHGDFNYRREGYLSGTSKITSTAIGKPRNLVFAGAPRGEGLNQVNKKAKNVPNVNIDKGPRLDTQILRRHTQEQVVEAIKVGQFSITDGPALRIAIDMNNNNIIDDEDIPMGGTLERNMDFGANIKLLVEWVSTTEFGPVRKIDIYVGAHTNKIFTGLDADTERTRVYAPMNHGVRNSRKDPAGVPGGSYTSTRTSSTAFRQKLKYTHLNDGYWQDPINKLHYSIDAKSPKGYKNVQIVSMDLLDFEAHRDISGDRFFIRVFAETNSIVPKYAYSNPIWVLNKELKAKQESK